MNVPETKVADLGGRSARRARAIWSGFASRHFLSLGQGDPDLVFIAGTGRSGTTWLAEILVRASRRRLVFEPFHSEYVPLWGDAASRQYIRPNDAETRFLEPGRRILSADFRNDWADSYNNRLLTRGRIVKEIRANLMLRWLYDQLGPFPLIFMIRHPGAVARSWARAKWSLLLTERFLSQSDLVEDYLATIERRLRSVADPFDQILYAWAIETAVPLSQFGPGEMLVVFYEHLLTTPEEELARVTEYLGGDFRRTRLRSSSQPSSTTTTGVSYESSSDRLYSWREALTDEQLLNVAAVPALFGLDCLYRTDGLPALSGDAVLRERGSFAPPPTTPAESP